MPERRKDPAPAHPAGSDWSVSRVMQRQPVAFPENETVLSVCESMAQSRIGQVLVVDKNWRPRAKLELPRNPKAFLPNAI